MIRGGVLIFTLLALLLAVLAAVEVVLAFLLPPWSLLWIGAGLAAGGAVLMGGLAARTLRRRAGQGRDLRDLGDLGDLGDQRGEREPRWLRWLP